MDWLTTNWQFVILMVYITGGFRWMLTRMDKISDRLNDIEKRLTVVETVLQMMGYPVKPKEKTGT